MESFKKKWEIQKNWQLIFPLIGIIGLIYSAFKLAYAFTNQLHIGLTIVLATIIFVLLLKVTLFLFKKLERKWVVDYKWEMIRIFIVFALTGSSSVLIGRPILKFVGISKENLNPVLYWILFILLGLIFYQIMLVAFGWLFGQFKFFWDFEKKMLKRFGLKRFIE